MVYTVSNIISVLAAEEDLAFGWITKSKAIRTEKKKLGEKPKIKATRSLYLSMEQNVLSSQNFTENDQVQ